MDSLEVSERRDVFSSLKSQRKEGLEERFRGKSQEELSLSANASLSGDLQSLEGREQKYMIGKRDTGMF